jgi:hypothetical protein
VTLNPTGLPRATPTVVPSQNPSPTPSFSPGKAVGRLEYPDTTLPAVESLICV